MRGSLAGESYQVPKDEHYNWRGECCRKRSKEYKDAKEKARTKLERGAKVVKIKQARNKEDGWKFSALNYPNFFPPAYLRSSE